MAEPFNPTPRAERVKPREPLIEFGSSGLRQTGGYLAEEFLPALSGKRSVAVFREMSDNDGTVGAIIYAITMLTRSVDWTVTPVDDSDAAQDAADFVDEVMHDMSHPWSEFIAEAMTMLVYGFAPMEVVWKKRVGPYERDARRRSKHDDGRFGIRKISLRGQDTIDRWQFSETGEVEGLWQQPYDGPPVFIPIERLLLFRTTPVKSNPEGRSVLRTAYRPWYFKKKVEEIEGIGLERDLAGYPVMRVPARLMSPDASPEEKAAFLSYQRLVTSIRRDQSEGVVLPSDRDDSGNLRYELELLSTGSTRTFNTVEVKAGYAREIAMSVLADFIFLGSAETAGSWALSSDKTELFAVAIGTFLGIVKDTVNRHLMPRLWALNGEDPDLMPQIDHGDIERPNLGELADFVTSMAGAGATMFPDRELENRLRKIAGLPDAPEDGPDTPGDLTMPQNAPGTAAAGAQGAPNAPPGGTPAGGAATARQGAAQNAAPGR